MVIGLGALLFLSLAGAVAGILLALESERLGWEPCYGLRRREREARSSSLASLSVALLAAAVLASQAVALPWLLVSGSGLFTLAMLIVAITLIEPRQGGDADKDSPCAWPEFDSERERWSRDPARPRPLTRA